MKSVLGQVEAARQDEAGRRSQAAKRKVRFGKGRMMRAAGLSHTTLNNWESGDSPGLDSLERLAEALNRRLIVRFAGLSDPSGSVYERPTEELDLSPQALRLAQMLDELEEGSDKAEIVGVVKGLIMATKARQNPHEPDVEESAGHRVRRKSP